MAAESVKKKIIISGSLAFDRIMDFPGLFSEHILPEKIHNLNISFQVNGLKEKFGGTAGNVAYALHLLGENPSITATIGRDYHSYFAWLKTNGISTESIRVIEDELTASAYITTDRADNQITGFNPGAMKHPTSLDFNRLNPAETLFIVSPGNLEDMVNYPRLCKARGVDYIFDPGQALPMLNGEKLVQAIDGSRILIANDYELELIKSKTGLSSPGLLMLTGNLIVTKGEKGSVVATPQGDKAVPAAKPARVLDPTGAGDAFRGGLLHGLVHGESIDRAAEMGSACASFCVEHYGTQEYAFSPAEFEARLSTF